MEHQDIKDRLSLFYENMDAGFGLTHWTYDAGGTLLDNNSYRPVPMEGFFQTNGCLEYAVEYGKSRRLPLLLGAPLGLMWCAAFEYQEDVLYRIHVLGPCFTNTISQDSIKKVASQRQIPLSFRSGFIEVMSSIPVVSSANMTRIALMLHQTITGEKLPQEEVVNQSLHRLDEQSELAEASQQIEAARKDRHNTYMGEQALLAAVRTGVMAPKAIENAGLNSDGVQVKGKDPLQQALVSVITFISLCTRAAIEGGLSPDRAYSTGDYYIQLAMDCNAVPELGEITDEMYREFITLVHDLKKKNDVSPVIRSCCDYIELHAEDDLPLEYLAKRSGYTEYYLSRKFKSEVGISVNEYINKTRVERAKTLLVSTNDDMQALSERLHFGTRSYFALTFKKYAGMSPSEYRKQNQKK